MLFDSHCHLQFKNFDEKKDVLEKCLAKKMFLNIVGSQKETSRKAVELAKQYKNFYASVGLHPIHLFKTRVDEEESSFFSHEEEFDFDFYQKLVDKKKVIAIGECGIDLFHLPQNINKEEVLEKQKKVLTSQIELARKNNLALIFHVRDSLEKTGEAHDELYKIIKKYKYLKGVVHCFTGNWSQAKKYLDLGLYLGFTGVITFPAKKTDPKPQKELLEVLEKIDLNKILIETDAPYLAPQKYRGEVCEPWMVEENLDFIAKLRKIDKNELENIIFKNSLTLFDKIIN